MRPLHLSMTAFGPYADLQEIPFAKLGARGLYLITGDTGAGKTTIFDAISYALYGAASGAERDASMLRSKYADDDVPTEVELTFLHGGREYRVKRSPEHMRKKSRGEGFTRRPASAELYYPDGRVETQTNRVTRCVVELLGIDRQQFSQIAMLAQGEFMKLLLAGTKERQQIFRDIFKTGVYRSFQDKLKDEAAAAARAREAAQASLRQYEAGLLCAPDSPCAPQVERARAGELLAADALMLLDALTAEDEAASARERAELAEVEARVEALTAAAARAGERRRAREELGAAQRALVEGAPELARRAAALEAERAKATAVEALEREAAAIEAELPSYAELDALRAAAERQAAALDLAARERELQQAQLSARQGAAQALREEMDTLAGTGESALRLSGERDKLAARRAEVLALQDALRALSELDAARQRAQRDYAAAAQAADAARALADARRRAFNDEQAGIMAEALRDGEPCPVCGSTVHPRRARKSAAAPSEAQVKSAEAEAQRAQEAANRLSARAAEARGRAESARSAAAGRAEALLGAGELDGAGERCGALLAKLKSQIDALEAQIRAEDARAKRRAELDALLPQAEQALADAAGELAKRREAAASAAAKLDEMRARRDALAAKLRFEGREAAERARTERTQRIAEHRDALARAERALADCERERAALGARIEQLQKLLDGGADEDEAALNAQKAALGARREELQGSLRALDHRLATNRAARDSIRAKSAQLRALDERYGWVKALSDTANGNLGGRERITLETYAQAAFFDRILGRANAQLMRMTLGKYDLVRRETPSDLRSQSGLELDVIDHYNGSRRDVRTLSGGEAFQASLCLALGLSEEIQSTAGGIRLDALFVDEGFGTLDEEALSLAMRALAGLAEGDRLVGIISHVSELRRQIDRQIVVTKERSGGSRARVVV